MTEYAATVWDPMQKTIYSSNWNDPRTARLWNNSSIRHVFTPGSRIIPYRVPQHLNMNHSSLFVVHSSWKSYADFTASEQVSSNIKIPLKSLLSLKKFLLLESLSLSVSVSISVSVSVSVSLFLVFFFFFSFFVLLPIIRARTLCKINVKRLPLETKNTLCLCVLCVCVCEGGGGLEGGVGGGVVSRESTVYYRNLLNSSVETISSLG